MDSVAIDFETANVKNDRACSIGLTYVMNNTVVESITYLIDPEVPISPKCTKLHGITNGMIAGHPNFRALWDNLNLHQVFRHYPLVAHNCAFDMSVLRKMAQHYKIDLPKITCYCSQVLWRTNYPETNIQSLSKICSYIGYTALNEHDSRSDSLAAASIMLYILNDQSTSVFPCEMNDDKRTDNDVDDTSTIVVEIVASYPEYGNQEPILQEADITYDEDLPIEFEGRSFVLTGDFGELGKDGVEAYITSRGGVCKSGVSKKTDYLIVGFQDVNVVTDAINAKSGKIIKAEELRASGEKIRLISDEFFYSIMNTLV